MKPAIKTRHLLLTSLLAGSTVLSTGCSSGRFSMASMNPFAKSTPAANSQPGPTARLTESIASAAGSTKNAFNKTTSAVAGVFSRDSEPEGGSPDPLSLSTKPKTVSPDVFVANGQLWESTGDAEKAMESYTKALENDPDNAPALTSTARLQFRQGNYQEASESFHKAIAQSPEDAGLHNDLGLTLGKMGDHAAATKSLQKALQLSPGTSRYANNLATVQFEAGNSSSAFQVLEKNNKPTVAHFNMAYLHFKQGQMTEAKGHLDNALQSAPEGEQDAVTQRAVERSRDMLAQIDSSMAPIAQAAPQATIAGGRFFGGAPQASVRQTSQTGTSDDVVTPAAPTSSTMAPAMKSIAPPSPTETTPSESKANESKAGESKTSESKANDTPSKTASSEAASPSEATEAKPTRPMPIRPTEAPKASESTTDSSGPSTAFPLPGGFGTTESK